MNCFNHLSTYIYAIVYYVDVGWDAVRWGRAFEEGNQHNGRAHHQTSDISLNN